MKIWSWLNSFVINFKYLYLFYRYEWTLLEIECMMSQKYKYLFYFILMDTYSKILSHNKDIPGYKGQDKMRRWISRKYYIKASPDELRDKNQDTVPITALTLILNDRFKYKISFSSVLFSLMDIQYTYMANKEKRNTSSTKVNQVSEYSQIKTHRQLKTFVL